MSRIILAAEATTLTLNGYVFTSFTEGDFLVIAPVNPLTSQTNSTNRGKNINARVDADVHDLTIRVQKYSQDDVRLNSWRNSASPTLIEGSAKTNYNRDGTEAVETYTFEGGSMTTQPTNTGNNQDGNSMMEYVIRCSAVRAL